MLVATSFRNKSVAVFGLARSGIAAAHSLLKGGARVHAWDDSEPAVEKARGDGIPIINLHNVDFRTVDALILSPGVPLTHPEPHWTVIKARAAGIPVIGDTEIFQREVLAAGARTVAITGTNGKSTTTALTGHVLKAAGLHVDVGGNIGTAVSLLRQPEKSSVYVLELSSFQIDLMPGLAPDVGILTNLTPDHLDRHGSMEHYAAVKARMFARQRAGQTALVGVDDSYSAAIADRIQTGATVRRVSVVKTLDDGISAAGGILVDRQAGQTAASIDLRGMGALRGAHNWQNACMAYGAARALGVEPGVIADAMASFPGLAHRMQEVGQVNGVPFINDSKATNADAAEKALSSFGTIYWIAGGIAKAGGIEPLAPYFPRIARAYLIGVAAEEFARTLKGKADFVITETLDRAVEAAASDAAKDPSGKAVVLLSPACASFDHYKNFEVRGDAFVKLVAGLPGAVMSVGGPA
jgi:UDP-N-acetylmuramoylalanine--D-glutamate ligase